MTGILKKHSKPLCFLFLCGLALQACTPAVKPAPPEPAIAEFSNVHDAMQSLLARRDVKISVRASWTEIVDASGTIWTFVPLTHPGYPTMMRQRVRRSPDGAIRVDMAVLCQSEKTPCERVIEDLRAWNRESAKRIAAGERD